MIFYELGKKTQFNGEDSYIDLTDKISYFLSAEKISIKCVFKTEEMKTMGILSIYFKEYFAKDLLIFMEKGYINISKRNILHTSKTAYNDNDEHILYVKMDKKGLLAYVDGDKIIEDTTKYPFCNFDYSCTINIGRDAEQNKPRDYFKGEISKFLISNEIMEYDSTKYKKDEIKRTPLFYNGLDNMVSYRIPTIIKLPSGTIVASADARVNDESDNPNNIIRAVKLSYDMGESFTENIFSTNYGGLGSCDGASALDGSLLYSEKTNTLFKLFTHSSKGVGFSSSKAGTGFNEKGEKILFGKDGKTYFIAEDKTIVQEDGSNTEYSVDLLGRVFKGERQVSSICQGNDRIFKQLDTCFLKIMCSTDEGKTWSEPLDLNQYVKKDWMKFIGACPGIGIQIKEGKYKGRLVYPVYYTNTHGISSSGVIYSDDNGESWAMGSSVNDGRIFNEKKITAKDTTEYLSTLGECQVAEIEDGNIKIFLRNLKYKKVATAISKDGGESFLDISVIEESKECFCQSSVLKLEHKNKTYHAFLNPDNTKYRIKGTIRLSDDNTKTFKYEKLIEAGEFLYSSMAQIDDNTIGVLYEGRNLDIYFVKIDIDWIKS